MKGFEETQVRMKKTYVEPSLIGIGRINHLTGMSKNLNWLDNSNGSNAWKNGRPQIEEGEEF